MNFLEGKKILFFAPNFHGLQNRISDVMISLGAEVDYYDERPSNTFLTKVIIRLKFKKIVFLKTLKYYNSILKATSRETYDYVFVINMEAMPKAILHKLRLQQEQAVFLLYMWDSLELKTISDTMLNYFDRAYTFDYRDAQKRNMILHHLFYSPEYVNKDHVKTEYDICFIGTIHGDRYKLLKHIQIQAEAMELRVYYYMYMPSRIMFWMRKIFDRNFKASINEVQFISMSQSEMALRMSKSTAIIDLSYKNQKGLSMRTFEVLALKRKLITTHKEVRKYDFYAKENIYILDKSISIDKDFVFSKSVGIQDDIYQKYSLENWINRIFLET